MVIPSSIILKRVGISEAVDGKLKAQTGQTVQKAAPVELKGEGSAAVAPAVTLRASVAVKRLPSRQGAPSLLPPQVAANAAPRLTAGVARVRPRLKLAAP